MIPAEPFFLPKNEAPDSPCLECIGGFYEIGRELDQTRASVVHHVAPASSSVAVRWHSPMESRWTDYSGFVSWLQPMYSILPPQCGHVLWMHCRPALTSTCDIMYGTCSVYVQSAHA